MKRPILTTASAFALALCALTVALWVGSYLAKTPPARPPPRVRWLRVDEGDDYIARTHGRFERWINTPWDGKWYQESSTPLWVPALTFLAFGVAGLILRKYLPPPARPRSMNLCPVCGYELRATPNRCPECGTAVSKESGGAA